MNVCMTNRMQEEMHFAKLLGAKLMQCYVIWCIIAMFGTNTCSFTEIRYTIFEFVLRYCLNYNEHRKDWIWTSHSMIMNTPITKNDGKL